MRARPFDGADARRFLERLAPPQDQFIELRLIIPDASPSQVFCRSIGEALQVVEHHSGSSNVYVGACPRVRRAGTKRDVTTVPAFWADVDFHQVHSDRNEARAIALERIYGFPLPPSMIVLTGNGVQPWWLLDVPVAIGSDWPLERLEAVNRGIAQRLGGDSVQDLARVLRVPGTINLPTKPKRQRGCAAVPASLLLGEGPAHSLAPFARFEAREIPDAGWSSLSQRDQMALPPNAEALLRDFQHLLARLGRHHTLTRTWLGRRTLKDASHSGFDWALARQLAAVGVTREAAVAILAAYRFGKSADATPHYLNRTIHKAYDHEQHERRPR